jgi:hypothetical protein
MGVVRSALAGITATSASLVEYGAQRVVVESFIDDESLEIDARDQRFNADAVETLAGQQDTLEFRYLPRAPKGPECLRW